MKIYQLYYTSCRKGLTSGMGFQTYSMSEGITEEERQEIERHCNYVEPRNLPSNPTKEEIEELFPIVFSFFKLSCGKTCILRIKYIGMDYSGRMGNYFCHALVFEGKLPFYPIQIYNSKIFTDRLTKEEEIAEFIKPLPIITEIKEEDFITTNDIQSFLKGISQKKRTKSLNELIDGIIDGKQNNKRIIFLDDVLNLHMWIAAATMTFTVSMANNITFNTYSFDAFSAKEFLCGCLDENLENEIKAEDKNYKFSMFNFKSGNSTNIELKSKFAKQASLEYTIIRDYRKDIINFIELFNYGEVDFNIDNCVNLFSIINNGLQKISHNDAINAIEFANKYGSEKALQKIMATVDDVALSKIMTNLNLRMAEVIFKFLFRISKITEKQEYIDKAYEFFFNSIHFMIVDGENLSIEEIIKLYEEIRLYNEGNLEYFVSKSICKHRLKNIAIYLEGGTARHAVFYFCSVFGDFMTLGKFQKSPIPWEYFGENINFREFIISCIKVLLENRDELNYCLKYILSDTDYFSNILNLAYIVCASEENYTALISSFSEILSTTPFYIVSEIIEKILQKKHGSDILILSFKYKIRGAGDKLNYFVSYCTNVFDKNIKYRNKCFPVALGVLVSSFNDYEFNMSFYEVITKYIKERNLEGSLGKKLAEKLVDEFQNLVHVKLPDETELSIIDEINDIKYLYKIYTSPNISEMIQCADVLYKDMIDVEEFLLNVDVFKFGGISKERYEEILNLMLKIICPKLNDVLSHMKVKRILLCDKYKVLYFNSYIKAMEDIFELKGDNKSYLDFICFMIKSQDLFSENQFKDIEKNIIDNIAKASAAHIEEYNQYIEKTIENTTRGKETRESVRVWLNIYKQAKQKIEGKSIFNKIQKIYKKQSNN